MPETLFQMRGITKHFPGVLALNQVDLEVRTGEVLALVGENGAGKSTLMNILSGASLKDAGEILLNGHRMEIQSPLDAQRRGISIVHQELMLVPQLSVAENIFLGRQPRTKLGFVDQRKMQEEASRLLDALGIQVDPGEAVGQLSVANQQMVEITKALSLNADLIILDEPTSALTEHEAAILFEVIRRLRGQGKAIIYISHKLEEVFAIADRITVLRDGRHVGTVLTHETTPQEIVAIMVGRALQPSEAKPRVERQQPLLEVLGLSRQDVLEAISLALYPGEIVGLAGLVGSGRSSLLRAIFGVDPIDGGAILLDGEGVEITSPKEAIALGLGFAPEDRKTQALLLELAVRENIVLPSLSRIGRHGFRQRGVEREIAQQFVEQLDIRTLSVEQEVLYLSGGNQQKVVLARWLALHPRVLLLDEPTRGIDVGAKREIHGLIRQLARDGVAILMASSELEEILGTCDRILVLHEGRLTGEFLRDEATQEKIAACATGQVTIRPAHE